jgi:hypothetical protein
MESSRDLSRERTELAKAQQKLVVSSSAESPLCWLFCWPVQKYFCNCEIFQFLRFLYECSIFYNQFCVYEGP